MAGLEGLKTISEDKAVISIGAGVTYTEAFDYFVEPNPRAWTADHRLGGEQVRNMGTIGGNIANGSPIGDTPPPLIALGASLTLRKGKERRDDPAGKLFHRLWQAGPKTRRIRRGCSRAGAAQRHAFCRLQGDQAARRGHYRNARRIFSDAREKRHGNCHPHRIWWHGGDAEAGANVEKALLGKAWTEEDVEAALPAFEQDFTPLTDMRATADIGRWLRESAGTLLCGDNRHERADQVSREAA